MVVLAGVEPVLAVGVELVVVEPVLAEDAELVVAEPVLAEDAELVVVEPELVVVLELFGHHRLDVLQEGINIKNKNIIHNKDKCLSCLSF